ncbi:MAG TPA: nucleotidyltransferase family protein [Burkholderiales bacterium]|nr:nucleotidyltransferase family protein [Burkholderiales bacterium]
MSAGAGSAPIVGILLAGGSASRFGSDKLLHPLAEGTPIAVASARNLIAAVPRVVAVVRPGAPDLERALRAAGAEVTVCDRAAEGMGVTLAHAVRAAGDAGGWVVALADMPFIRPETIRRVVAAVAGGAAIAAPEFRGERGHPVGFARRFRSALEQLAGDAGAREIVKADPAALARVAVDDPGVVRDIDTPADLARG